MLRICYAHGQKAILPMIHILLTYNEFLRLSNVHNLDFQKLRNGLLNGFNLSKEWAQLWAVADLQGRLNSTGKLNYHFNYHSYSN